VTGDLKEAVRRITSEIRVAGMKPKERLKDLKPNELLRFFKSEEILRGLKPADRLKGLKTEELKRLKEILDKLNLN